MESDESVANFDPEFTTADVREAGPGDIMDLDEEDPSEDWVTLSHSITGSLHTPNGPLGSDRPAMKGIEIAPRRKKKRDEAGSPLTSSVQENFRGFTYHGGESIVPPAAGLLAEKQPEEHAVQDEDLPEPSTDDDLADDTPAGRYSRRRKDQDDLDGFDEDMHV